MITNPHAGTPTEAGWAMGFAFGFMGPNFSDTPPAVIAPELIDAFNEGQLVGQQSAIDGVALSSDCMDASQDVGSGAEAVVHGLDVLEVIGISVDFLASHIGHGVAGIAVLLFELTIPGPPAPTPEDVLPSLGQKFVSALSSMGIDSGDLFVAAGVDMQAAGCEFKFSNLFKTLDQARESADAMGRPHRAIAHWQLDASGSFEIVEAS
jgi:hypothetical protein